MVLLVIVAMLVNVVVVIEPVFTYVPPWVVVRESVEVPEVNPELLNLSVLAAPLSPVKVIPAIELSVSKLVAIVAK